MKLSSVRSFFDARFFKFLLVGAANTLVSALIMFGLYNLLHFGYWGSSAVSYLVGSVMSFFLNRSFTFSSHDAMWKSAVRFAVNVAVCYVIAYSIAKPAVLWVLSGTGWTENAVEQIAMLFGMCLFTGLNYIGQRYFAFRR